MAKFTLNGYNSYSGCDIVVTARLNKITGTKKELKEKVYTLGSLQTLSVSTHQDKKPVRVIGSVNALDYTMGQRTIAGSLVFAVFDQHFATEMFNDLSEATGKTFLLPDELPAIDLTITFANEYGRTSRMAIYGVRIINEGQVMSINDLYTENTYQFVATAMEPLKKGEDIGSSSSINNTNYIGSAIITDGKDYGNNIGEQIYNKGKSLSFEDFNRITLTASIEQPFYNEEEGIARFYLSPNQISGIISILDRKKDKIIEQIQVSKEAIQYSTFLTAGLYSAWYQDNNQILSNTVDFSIISNATFDNSIDDTPTIENVTKNSVRFISNNPTHTIGVITNSETLDTIEVELQSRIGYVAGLDPYKQYSIYTKSNDTYSKNALVKTLKEDFNIIDNYKDYVKYNSKLLSKDYTEYETILNNIQDDDILTALNKNKSEEAKELMFMAIKYKNEFIFSINSSNYEYIPTKNIDNVFGNSFKFNSGVTKANIFVNRNKKDYFESTELYPTEINYIGKANSLYSVVGITNDYAKSPKYYFYSYSDNSKERILKAFGNVNVLGSLDIYQFRKDSKLSNNGLKCIAAKEYKTKDINLLKAPSLFIDESLNIIADVNYIESLGLKGYEYYLCICKLDEVLDTTPVRKLKMYDWPETLIIDSYVSAINKKDIYCTWIEDERFNIISDIGFTSLSEEIIDINSYIVDNELNTIIKKLETAIKKPNYLSDLRLLINTQEVTLKNLYYEIACALIQLKENEAFYLINELFKIYFQDICVNKEKYKKATFDVNNKLIKFENTENVDLIKITFKKNDYSIKAILGNSDIVNNEDITLYYLISNNPVIKSGYVLIEGKNYTSHLIGLEEI